MFKADKSTLIAIGAAVAGLIVLIRWNNKSAAVSLPGAATPSALFPAFSAAATPGQVSAAPTTIAPTWTAVATPAAAPGPSFGVDAPVSYVYSGPDQSTFAHLSDEQRAGRTDGQLVLSMLGY